MNMLRLFLKIWECPISLLFDETVVRVHYCCVSHGVNWKQCFGRVGGVLGVIVL